MVKTPAATPTTIEPHRAEPSEGIWFETKSGRRVELTASGLEQWFARIEAGIRESAAKKAENREAEKTSPDLIARYASQYGFKNPNDLIDFLKSPAGETTQEVIGAEIAEAIALQEELQQQLRDEEIRRHRLIALLLFYFMSKRDAKAQELRERIQEDIDKLLKEEIAIEKANQAMSAAPATAAADYERAKLDYLNSLEELKELNKGMDALIAKTEKIALRYLKYQNSAKEAENNINDLLNGRDFHTLSEEEKLPLHAKIDDQLAALTKKMDINARQIQKLVDLGSMHDGVVDATHVRQGLAEEEFLGTPLLEVARAKIEDSTADNLHVATLKDLKSVLNGDKVFCNRSGSPVTSLDEAELVLPKDMARMLREEKKQIVEYEGKYYLIKQGQDVKDLSVDEKHAAYEACKSLRPQERATVKHLIQHNNGLEHRENEHHKDIIFQKQQLQIQKIMEFANVVARIQAQRANQAILEQQVQATLAQSQPSRGLSSSPTMAPVMAPTPPKMTPLPTTPAKTAASPSHHTQMMKILQPVRNALPQEIIDVLQQKYANVQDTKLQHGLMQLKPGERIPDRTWQALMRVPIPRGVMSTLQSTMERFAAGMSGSILEIDKAKEHTPAAPRPNPLSTNPYGSQ
ncbi:hypothetical protein [Legionella oakridgensis]|uniref:hypothetical protein n=1 Tax=Legionella oakridgensis TaxID=29423 RepID=UPI0003DE0B21|nr:hypothetical protein [Legionella oakridgensis]ETO93593.1 hypothetical protein LOR_57c13200 [Legionella oakridgensis RV-2-2007]